MRKILFLMAVAFVISSCGVGTYVPWAQNHFGAETRVVLDKANFRVVRDVEAVIEVDNTNLKRQDVEKSAYGQLLRNARLTGSQVLINVVIEEVLRENTNIFRALFRISPKRKQYVAARATVIEFLKEDGEPIQSVSRSTSNNTPQPIAVSKSQSTEPKKTIDTNKKYVNKERLNQLDERKNAVYQQFKRWNFLKSKFYLGYIEVYEYLYNDPTEENINTLEDIQIYVDKIKTVQEVIEEEKVGKQMSNETSIDEKIAILLETARKYIK